MIDTVAYTQPIKFREIQKGFFPEWEKQSKKTAKVKGEIIPVSLWKHRGTGLRVEFRPKLSARVEVSLPRMLYPRNSRLLLSQDAIDEAFKEVSRLIKQIGEIRLRSKYFERVDLAWQFLCDHSSLIETHEYLLHSEIRSYPINYHRETLLWAGDSMSVEMYDKGAEQKDDSMKNKVSRVEIRLTKKKLRDLLGDEGVVSELDFNKCYSVYREKLGDFSPPPCITLSKEADWIRYAAQERWKIFGRPALGYFFRNLSSSRLRKRLREHQSPILDAYGLNWRKILPEDKPPRTKRIGDYDATPCGHPRTP